jgi:hypothetical protein
MHEHDHESEEHDHEDKLSPSSRKPRKAYTITKQRENWSEEEHQKFLEALKLYATGINTFVTHMLHRFDRDWKKIEKFIGSKSVIQVRAKVRVRPCVSEMILDSKPCTKVLFESAKEQHR